MNNTPTINFISKEMQNSKYDWANISIGNDRIGKARCLINDCEITIFSVNIFPEFEGLGYGKYFVEECKKHFSAIIADRVRSTAIGFWEKLDFENMGNGNYIYKK